MGGTLPRGNTNVGTYSRPASASLTPRNASLSTNTTNTLHPSNTLDRFQGNPAHTDPTFAANGPPSSQQQPRPPNFSSPAANAQRPPSRGLALLKNLSRGVSGNLDRDAAGTTIQSGVIPRSNSYSLAAAAAAAAATASATGWTPSPLTGRVASPTQDQNQQQQGTPLVRVPSLPALHGRPLSAVAYPSTSQLPPARACPSSPHQQQQQQGRHNPLPATPCEPPV